MVFNTYSTSISPFSSQLSANNSVDNTSITSPTIHNLADSDTSANNNLTNPISTSSVSTSNEILCISLIGLTYLVLKLNNKHSYTMLLSSDYNGKYILKYSESPSFSELKALNKVFFVEMSDISIENKDKSSGNLLTYINSLNQNELKNNTDGTKNNTNDIKSDTVVVDNTKQSNTAGNSNNTAGNDEFNKTDNDSKNNNTTDNDSKNMKKKRNSSNLQFVIIISVLLGFAALVAYLFLKRTIIKDFLNE